MSKVESTYGNRSAFRDGIGEHRPDHAGARRIIGCANLEQCRTRCWRHPVGVGGSHQSSQCCIAGSIRRETAAIERRHRDAEVMVVEGAIAGAAPRQILHPPDEGVLHQHEGALVEAVAQHAAFLVGVGIAVRKGNETMRMALNWGLFRVWEQGLALC